MTWQEFYAKVTNPFGAKGEFYDAQGHRGSDYGADPGEAIPAYCGGVVRYVDNSYTLGGIIGVELDDGLFAGWAHLSPVNLGVGTRFEAGDTIGYASGRDGNHGTLWDGSHCHTTLSEVSAVAAATGARPLLDPVPIIQAYIHSTQSTDGDNEMAKRQAFYELKGGTYNVIVGETSSGWFMEYTSNSSDYNAIIADRFETGTMIEDKGGTMIRAFKNSLKRVVGDN